MFAEFNIVPVDLVVRHVGVLVLDGPLLAEFLADFTEMMLGRVVLVECILVVEVQALAEVTHRMVFLDVQLVRLLIVDLLLKHQHRLVIETKLAHCLPVISLVVVAQLLGRLEFSNRLLVAVPANEPELARHIDLDGRVLKP